MNDKELIEAVAVEVMGWDKIISIYDQPGKMAYFYVIGDEQVYFDHHDFKPLTNANHWMMVVQSMRELEYRVWIGQSLDLWECGFSIACYTKGFYRHQSIGHAICLASLEAVRATRDQSGAKEK